MWGGGFIWLNIDSPVISMFKDDVSLLGSANTIGRYLRKTKATNPIHSGHLVVTHQK